MPWNSQGGNGNGGGPWGGGNGNGNNDNPWGKKPSGGPRKRPPPQGPDFDELKRKFDQFSGGFGSGGPIRWGVLGLGLVVVFALWMATGIFIVDEGSQGVVTRFGERHRVTGSGPHFHLPYPIEQSYTVPVVEQRREEIGGRSGPSGTSEILTGDESFVDIEYTIIWQVDDPANFLFNVLWPELTIRAIGESTMREVVGGRNFNEIIGVGRGEVEATVNPLRAQAEIEREVSEKLQETLNSLQAGVRIAQITITKILPPETVIPSVNAVQIAQSDAKVKINRASAEVNQLIPNARGDAEGLIGNAEGQAARIVAEAKGQASRFDAVRQEYEKSPVEVHRRIYTETMVGIYRNSKTTLIDKALPGTILVPYGTNPPLGAVLDQPR